MRLPFEAKTARALTHKAWQEQPLNLAKNMCNVSFAVLVLG
ncbi:Uncharacterised protein [Serratia plymuthica]|nr:Uncharacterised protein [Serratia plymuthica]